MLHSYLITSFSRGCERCLLLGIESDQLGSKCIFIISSSPSIFENIHQSWNFLDRTSAFISTFIFTFLQYHLQDLMFFISSSSLVSTSTCQKTQAIRYSSSSRKTKLVSNQLKLYYMCLWTLSFLLQHVEIR